MMADRSLTPADLERARDRLSNRIAVTPVVASASLSQRCGVPVSVKLEHQQGTGSFKLRGATNAILCLDDEQRRRGVVGVSTGNHGRGLALAARRAGVRCIICMSRLVPQNKIDGIRAEGAEVHIAGSSQDEAQGQVDRLVGDEGMTMVPPFEDPAIIAGQGTLGLELIEQVPDLKTVLVQVSGGGLAAGIAMALKSRDRDIRVIGVSMERGAAMHASLAAGKPVLVDEQPTLADSLGGGIGLDNCYTFALVRDLVDDMVLVSEAEIAAGIRHVYWQERQIVEGAGAVGVAALLAGKVRPVGSTVVLLSGGNIDMRLHHRIICGEDVDVSKEAI